MENPYKEPLKKCVLCEKRVDYKNVQVSTGDAWLGVCSEDCHASRFYVGWIQQFQGVKSCSTFLC
jgi:hypothetical protein